MPITSIALALLPLAGPTTGDTLYAVTDGGNLVTFDAADPSAVTTVGSLGLPPTVAISGLTYHPSFNRLYAIGRQPGPGGSTDAFLVDIIPATGTAFVGDLIMNSAAVGNVESLEYVHSRQTIVIAHSDGGSSDFVSDRYATLQLSTGAVFPLSSSALDTDAMAYVPATDTTFSVDPNGADWARLDLDSGASSAAGGATDSLGDVTYGPLTGSVYGVDGLTGELLRHDLVGGGAALGPAVSMGAIAGDAVLGLTALAPRRVGAPFCSPNPNSTGAPSELRAFGSEAVADNRLQLGAYDLPPNAFGFFVVSRASSLGVVPAGSQGNLCLAGFIGRYIAPGQIQNSGVLGAITLEVDLTAIPQPSSFVSATAGDAWFFQCWHRDVVGGAQTSNFTPAIEVQFN